MGRAKTANQKKTTASAKCGQPKRRQQKRTQKTGAESQDRQKTLQQAAKVANDVALKLKLTEKLQNSGFSLGLDGVEMVTIPSDNLNDSHTGPSSSKDPLAEAILKADSSSSTTSEEDDQTDIDDQSNIDDEDFLPNQDDESSEQETSDETASQSDKAEATVDDEELPFPVPIKVNLSSIEMQPGSVQANNQAGTAADYWKEKFTKQLEQTKKLSNDLLLEKAKSARLNQLVITQMAMIREIRLGKETSVFTTEPGIGITTAELEDISSQSKHTADFAQRLALYFYGADELRKKKVTTKGDPGLTPIAPKLLKFIHNKARQRVAKLEGLDAYEKIAIEANPATINKALAEKIQNLRKAYILRQAHGNH